MRTPLRTIAKPSARSTSSLMTDGAGSDDMVPPLECRTVVTLKMESDERVTYIVAAQVASCLLEPVDNRLGEPQAPTVLWTTRDGVPK